jgi:hypothetical protein
VKEPFRNDDLTLIRAFAELGLMWPFHRHAPNPTAPQHIAPSDAKNLKDTT